MHGLFRKTKWAATNQLLGRGIVFEYILLLNQIHLTTMCCSIIPLRFSIFYMLFIIWVHSFSKMLPYIKFAEDKVLVFVVLHEKW